MTDDDNERIIGDRNSKFIIYTADGTEFHLDEFDETTATGTFQYKTRRIKFHPEHVVAYSERIDK